MQVWDRALRMSDQAPLLHDCSVRPGGEAQAEYVLRYAAGHGGVPARSAPGTSQARHGGHTPVH
jgi:hypothetical protein